MTEITNLSSYFSHLSHTVEKLPFASIEQIIEVLLGAYETEQMIYLFGNGGSAALASHFACDLNKGTLNGSGKRFRVLAFTDNVPLLTAWANDSKYEDIFSEQLSNFVRPNDVAFAISGSGNSPNVLRALRVARDAGAITLGLTGFDGGKMREWCDFCTVVPSNNMQIIEDLHVSVTHAMFTAIRRRIANAAEAVAAAS